MARRKNPPITKMGKEGVQQQKISRQNTNAKNKDRSKRMENWVAAYFGEYGKRVPMSGAAGSWKGDVVVELQNNPGQFLIECKLSAAYHRPTDSPTLRLEFAWLPKLEEEVAITKSKFGVLIFHYFKKGESGYYVLLSPKVLELFIHKYEVEDSALLVQMLNAPVSADWSTGSTGKTRVAYNLTRKEVEAILTPYALYRAAKVRTPVGDYILMPLKNYRDIIAAL